MLKITKLFDMPTSKKNNGNHKVIRFSISKGVNRLLN